LQKCAVKFVVKLAATGISLAASAIFTVCHPQIVGQSFSLLENSNSPSFSLTNPAPLYFGNSNSYSLTKPQPQYWIGISNLPLVKLHEAPRHSLSPGIYETRPYAGIVLVPKLAGSDDVKPETVRPVMPVENPGLEFIPVAPLPNSMTNAIPD